MTNVILEVLCGWLAANLLLAAFWVWWKVRAARRDPAIRLVRMHKASRAAEEQRPEKAKDTPQPGNRDPLLRELCEPQLRKPPTPRPKPRTNRVRKVLNRTSRVITREKGRANKKQG
jgi:hypothetical protein